MITFTHAGRFGDLISSLNFCLQLAQHFNQSKFNFHIQTGVKYQPSKVEQASFGPQPVLITNKMAKFIKPLLVGQPYINQVLVGDQIPAKAINLNDFRKEPLNTMCGDIRDWYYSLTNIMLPREFWKRIIFAQPNQKYKDKVLFTLTERYVNCCIDYKQLEQFKDQLVFLGTEHQYKVFCKNYFKLDYVGKQNNLLRVAELMTGAKGYISNQTGLYCVAEGLKIPRAVISPDFVKIEGQTTIGPVNNIPLGGCTASIHSTQKLVDTVKCLLS